MRINPPELTTKILIFILLGRINKKEESMISGIGERGFTLLELCLAGSIMGLMAALCWPSLRTYTQQISVRNAAADLAQHLDEARERAVLAGKKQIIVPSPSPLLMASSAQAVFFPDGSAEPFYA